MTPAAFMAWRHAVSAARAESVAHRNAHPRTSFCTAALTAVLALSAISPVSAEECDPNYDPCVPVASDVDCAGGSGNGPEYVYGPVTVIGQDIYGLDRNHDGVGCE